MRAVETRRLTLVVAAAAVVVARRLLLLVLAAVVLVEPSSDGSTILLQLIATPLVLVAVAVLLMAVLALRVSSSLRNCTKRARGWLSLMSAFTSRSIRDGLLTALRSPPTRSTTRRMAGRSPLPLMQPMQAST